MLRCWRRSATRCGAQPAEVVSLAAGGTWAALRRSRSVKSIGLISSGGKPPFEEKKVALHDEPGNYQASFASDSGRHIMNFLECIKSRQRPVCDIEIGAFATIPALMGAMSIRNGGKTIAWNGHGAAPLA